MHQGWMFSIQWKYVVSQFFGTKVVCPRFTASIAGLANVAASTYHWSVRRGSITALERSPCGTVWRCGSIFSISPFASS